MPLHLQGSGGHTAELLQLLKCLPHTYNPRHYIMAATDKMSEDKIVRFENSESGGAGNVVSRVTVSRIPRSREVGQGYLSSIFTTLYAQLYTALPVLAARPDILLVNGPGTCIPVCMWVFVLRVLGLCKGKIVYVESICRVDTLSLSALLLLPIADHILVQWPQLQFKYPRCKYIGRLVS